MKILLINPGSSEDILTRVMREIPYLDSPAFFAPHALAAVAAVTPDGHDVRIHDENMRGPVDKLLASEAFDVIGITLTTNQFRRTLAIVEGCRAAGYAGRIVVGGIGAGTMLSRLKEKVDTLFWGEVEDTWPRFLEDLQAGCPKAVYQKVAKPDMANTPVPRWDLIGDDIRRYCAVSVQTARGCPFDCAFCDVIYTYGRRVRMKPVQRVLEEVRQLERLGAKMVMFADDNFAADRAYVKDLLRQLVPLNNSFSLPLGFLTQLDITIAEDEELLELLADSNFVEVQIGIESTSVASLKDMNKHQNLKGDIVQAVRRIQSYGIVVMAHMIIGTDSDDATAFDRTANFLREANVTHHQCHPLIAPPGTKMWYDLKRQGRLVAFTDDMRDRLDITTNILPARMTRVELMEGLADYWDRVHDPADYTQRAIAFLDGITRRPKVKEAMLVSLWRNRSMMTGTFSYYSRKVSPEHRKAFFDVVKATQKVSPSLMPRMMFVHTGYRMDCLRARHSSAIARDQAAIEKAHPDRIQVLSDRTRISPALRDQMPAIARAAHGAIRPHIGTREALFARTLEAIVDYHDRFGATLVAFDEVQADHLAMACERVLAKAAAGTGAGAAGTADPGDAAAVGPDGDIGSVRGGPPAGFAREILDALDRAVNVAHGGWEDQEPA
jgi:radical SAM superfamily enzyme YgiQ (UPF0313 family)